MRYFIEVSYKGTMYHGWQAQKNSVTVQGVLNNCLSKILNSQIEIVGSSRTDTGVHALQQYAHFDINFKLNCEKFVYSLNSVLPKDIAIKSIFCVADDKHARYSAVSRTYNYKIINKKDPFLSDVALFYNKNFDINLLNGAAKILVSNSLDCSGLCKTDSSTQHHLCDILSAGWVLNDGCLIFEIKANRFLRGMVRIIVSYLLKVGEGKITVQDFYNIVKNNSKITNPQLAPAHGLSLISVCY